MAETTKPDLTYVCPSCGQHAVIGTHFCRTSERDPGPDREPSRRRGGGNNGFFGMVGALMVMILLWRWIGPGALVLAAVGLLLFFGLGWRSDAEFKTLVRLCPDEETARQLVDEELLANPGISRRQAIRRLISRRQS